MSLPSPMLDLTIVNQKLAAKPDLSIWASANAGAGKTKVLIDRIARLLLRGSDPARILAVTYTKAAAAEMQTRLYGLLGSWTISPDQALTKALRDLDPELGEIDAAYLARARALFAKALETPGGLKIQTIHGFCQTILQRFPLEAGVPPGFTVLEDAAAHQLQAHAFERAFTKTPEAFLTLARLTSQDDDRSLILEALANAGATLPTKPDFATIAARLATKLDIDPALPAEAYRDAALNDLDLTSLADAAARLETGVANDKSTAAGLRELIALQDPDARWEAWRGIVRTEKGEPRQRPVSTAFKDDVIVSKVFDPHTGLGGLFTAAEAKICGRRLYDRSLALTQAAYSFQEAWTQIKQEIGALDFDDLLIKTSHLLGAGDGAAAWVLYKLDAGLAHVLIDEAQDTNPQQWDLLEPLFSALEEEATQPPRTRFIVGDEKQSIYSFQGARPERFLDEKAQFEATESPWAMHRASVSFELSFRSCQMVLNAVDTVWTHATLGQVPVLAEAPADAPFERKYAFRTRHIAHRQDYIGAVEFWPKTMPGDKASTPEAWDHPFNIEREDSSRNRLAERIALELKARLANGFAIGGPNGMRAMQAGDVMILVKRRGSFFHQLIKRLKYHKVPVAGADRLKLVEDPAIQDLMALGRFALLPQDDFNTACVLKGAFCGLVDDDDHLFPLAWNRGQTSIWQRLQASTNPDHVAAAVFLHKLLNRAGHLPPYEFFAAILEEPGLGGLTGWRLLIERLGQEAREPVEAFLGRALNHGRQETPTLHGFLSAIETDAADIKREMEQGGEGVRVMTIHAAKGLEAPVVILPDTTSARARDRSPPVFQSDLGCFLWSHSKNEDPPLFSDIRQSQIDADKREDARLLYVAMTRARDLLILCGFHSGKRPSENPAKKDKPKEGAKSWYELFEMALPLLGEGEIRQGHDFDYRLWGRHGDPQSELIHPHRDLAALPAWINQPPPPEKQRARRIAPSALTPDGAEPPTLSPLQPDARTRFLRGRLIHELLQRLPDVPEDQRASRAMARLQREADLDDDARRHMVAETLAVLNDPTFAPLFGQGSRAEAAIVGRGPGLPEDMVVNGTVDRLVVTETEVLVLDFKTNRPPPQSVAGVAQVYINQMAAYQALLRGRWPGKRVRCALVWTDGPRLMELPDQILASALQAIAGLPS